MNIRKILVVALGGRAWKGKVEGKVLGEGKEKREGRRKEGIGE